MRRAWKSPHTEQRGNLAIGVLPRQPHLDVVGLVRGRSPCRRCTAAWCDRRARGASALPRRRPSCARARPRALLGRRDRRPAPPWRTGACRIMPRVSARRARLGAEARRVRRDPDRQLRFVENQSRTRLVSGTSAVGMSQSLSEVWYSDALALHFSSTWIRYRNVSLVATDARRFVEKSPIRFRQSHLVKPDYPAQTASVNR